jgi:hypothetical protein
MYFVRGFECACILKLKQPPTIFLVPIEALCGASTFGDGDLITNTKMTLQLPGSMFLLLFWIKGHSEFQSNSSIVLPFGAYFWLSRTELLPIVSCLLVSRDFRPQPMRKKGHVRS